MNSREAERLLETVASNFLSYRSLRLELLISICFLCDWKHQIEFNRSITDAVWCVEHNRVISHDLERVAVTFSKFQVSDTFGVPTVSAASKLLIQFGLGTTARQVCDHIFASTANQSDFNINRLIISTYPFNYAGELDLPAISTEYRKKFGTEYVSLKTA